MKLIAFTLFFVMSIAVNAATLQDSESANSFTVRGDSVEQNIELDATALEYCNEKSQYKIWFNQNLKGKPITELNGLYYVAIDNKWMLLSDLLVRNGYLYSPQLQNSVEHASSERRGEWKCSSKEAIFKMVLQNDNTSKVITAIAMNESKLNGYPWPWTINVQGKSFYFATREEAHSKIQALVKEGVSNFDVGLMQVNWGFHSKRFASPWDALQPSKNIMVANDILMGLLKKYGTWKKAIQCYHNCNQINEQYILNFTKQFADIEKF